MTTIEILEGQIKNFLLTSVVFSLENKKIKSGKLILFSVRDFFCIFTLFDEIKNKKTIYEIPYPFGTRVVDNSLELDYTTDTFGEKCNGIEDMLIKFRPKKASKLYDKKLVITSII
jgi:hypothetical protein